MLSSWGFVKYLVVKRARVLNFKGKPLPENSSRRNHHLRQWNKLQDLFSFCKCSASHHRPVRMNMKLVFICIHTLTAFLVFPVNQKFLQQDWILLPTTKMSELKQLFTQLKWISWVISQFEMVKIFHPLGVKFCQITATRVFQNGWYANGRM